MQQEINAAAAFLVNIIARHPRHEELTQDHIEAFAAALIANMQSSFSNSSWDPELPMRGSANRCIRINFGVIDKVVLDSAKEAGISSFISKILPSELTMWVDPFEVSYKLNDKCPPFTIYNGLAKEEKATIIGTSGPSSPTMFAYPTTAVPSSPHLMRSAPSSPVMFYAYPAAPSPAVPVM